MKNTLEVNEFLKHFNYNLYNNEQIGFDKKTILDIYDLLKKINLPESLISTLLNNIAYLKSSSINIPLFLEILIRSIGFISIYELNEVIKVVKEIHDLYYKNARKIPFEEYLHDTEETRLKKIFLDRNNKYLIKDFTNIEQYINELKFAAALSLDQKKYNEFLSYIDDFIFNKERYSPMVNFKTYSKIRASLKATAKLYWDIYYGLEYIIAFNKHNLRITDIYNQNTYNEKEIKENIGEAIQLDIFTYQEYEDKKVSLPKDLKLLQISSLYNQANIPGSNTEKELLAYYNNFLKSRDVINLPKLKAHHNPSYIFEIN